MDFYLGMVIPWAINFLPMGWLLCDGSTLQISQYQALYSLLGNMYGGDGVNTFKLPDLRGRIIVGGGAGPGLTQYQPGDMGGAEGICINTTNMPVHTHALMGNTNTALPSTATPASTSVLSIGKDALGKTIKMYGNVSTTQPTLTPMNAQSIGTAGEGNPISVMQPYQTINYYICVSGLYPSRQ